MARDKDQNQDDSKEPMTPEEKLFKLIAGNRGADSEEFSDEDFMEQSFLSRLEGWYEGIEEKLKAGVKSLVGQGSPLSRVAIPASQLQVIQEWTQIRSINRGLLAVVVLLFFYLLIDMVFSRHDRMERLDIDESLRAISMPSFQGAQGNLSDYIKKTERRNVFQLPLPVVSPASAEKKENDGLNTPATVGNPAPPANVKLVGISWDADEYVAMIEYDPAKDGASFVRKGETLGNGMTVEEIKEYSVVLTQDGQKWELT